jgi:hypothetical protein
MQRLQRVKDNELPVVVGGWSFSELLNFEKNL